MKARIKSIQICDVKVRQRFVFTDSYDGDSKTEYVKVTPTHYRKAAAEHGCCMPVVRLSRGIRTQVVVS